MAPNTQFSTYLNSNAGYFNILFSFYCFLYNGLLFLHCLRVVKNTGLSHECGTVGNYVISHQFVTTRLFINRFLMNKNTCIWQYSRYDGLHLRFITGCVKIHKVSLHVIVVKSQMKAEIPGLFENIQCSYVQNSLSSKYFDRKANFCVFLAHKCY